MKVNNPFRMTFPETKEKKHQNVQYLTFMSSICHEGSMGRVQQIEHKFQAMHTHTIRVSYIHEWLICMVNFRKNPMDAMGIVF